jgi:hypothetical protein
MRLVRVFAVVVALAVGSSFGWALGVNGGLDSFDNALQLVRGNDADPAHQAAIDAARAKLADPKITTVEKQVKAFAAGIAIVEKSYGTLDAFSQQGGFQSAQLVAGITLPVSVQASMAQGVLLEYVSTPLAIVGLSKKLLKISNLYAKATDPVQTPELQKQLKGLAKASKQFAAFYKRYHKTK